MIDQNLINELEKITEPGPLIAELDRRFPKRMAIGTSGQLTGCALIDMTVQAKVKPRVFTNDTLRLFPETSELFTALEKKYNLQIERFIPDPKDLEPMIKTYGEYLFFDSKEKQELCCNIRKVLPNNKALDTLDVWITGLRADQSKARSRVGRFEIIYHHSSASRVPSPESESPSGSIDSRQGTPDAGRPILKVAPLADWTEQKVREYLKAHLVPVHKLLDQKLPGGYYYESLGCILCTTPIGPNEPRRAGRWRWFNALNDDKECGIHLPTIDKS